MQSKVQEVEYNGKPKEECGVFGIYSNDVTDVAERTYYSLYALQHRGQESCGIAVNDEGIINYYRDVGLVPDVFTHERLEKLGEGNMAIGHVRYSKKGNITRSNAEPLVVRHIKGPMAISHNGCLINGHKLKKEFELEGGIFHGTNDAEVIAYTITAQRLLTGSIEKAVEQAMYKMQGAYSLLVMSPSKLIAARDPMGFRPLCMGQTKDNCIVFASESCALDILGAVFLRDLEPGEIVIVSHKGIESNKTHCGNKGSLCLFEYLYFARPDSIINGISVHKARFNIGRILAKEHPANADVVIGVPDSGIDAALGYAKESGIQYDVGFIKNRYVTRSFIKPTQNQRDDAVRIKFNAIKPIVSGKSVVIIDDSIVRGTSSRRIVKLIREAGAREVHMRISAPPFIDLCYFGTDIDSRKNLIAYKMSNDEITKHIGADSLGFLSVKGINSIGEEHGCGFCDGCFTGVYPIEVPDELHKDKFEHKIHQEMQIKF